MKRLKWIMLTTAALGIGLAGIALVTVTLSPNDGKGIGIPAARAAVETLKAGTVDPANGKKIKYWVAPMDPTYIRDEPGKSPMGMDLVPVYQEEGGEKEPASTIRIDPVTIQNMGIRTTTVEMDSPVKTIRTFGNVTFDETRIYAVNTKFNGWIEKLHVNFEGEKVAKGQPLFKIYSPELVTAQQEYLLALEQQKALQNSRFTQASQGADRLLAAARTRLEYWDISPEQIRSLTQSGRTSKTITIFSPASGVVTKKNAVLGHYVKAGEHQYEIADLSTVWVDVEIYEYELPWIKGKMPAEMELAYIPGKRFFGKVLFIYPYLNPKTRTARLRLEFPNEDNHLKPDMYSNVYLKSRLDQRSPVIPQEAVIDSGVRKLVFVAGDKGRYEPREVELGLELSDHRYQVLKGLSQGEKIVVSAQFMLDSESRLREAVQKMLAVKNADALAPTAADDLDLSNVTMEADDLDMSDLTME